MTIIKGSGSFIPSELSDDAYINKYGKMVPAVCKFVANRKHFSATSPVSGEKIFTNLEMAEKASLSAMHSAGISNKEIDMILYSSCTPDFLLPPCFSLLQKRLGIKRCIGFDIRSGCAGFGTAMTIADTYIKSGQAHNILLVGSDVISTRFTSLPVKEYKLKHAFNHMFFGDCAGALVLSDSKDADRGILYTEMCSDHANADMGSCMPIGGSLYPYPNNDVKEEQWPVFQAPDLSEKYLSEVLISSMKTFEKNTNTNLRDVDAFVMPVESERIKKHVLEALPAIQENKIYTGSDGGALVNAAVPYAIDKAISEGKIKKNSKVLIYAAENTQWQHALIYVKW